MTGVNNTSVDCMVAGEDCPGGMMQLDGWVVLLMSTIHHGATLDDLCRDRAQAGGEESVRPLYLLWRQCTRSSRPKMFKMSCFTFTQLISPLIHRFVIDAVIKMAPLVASSGDRRHGYGSRGRRAPVKFVIQRLEIRTARRLQRFWSG